MISFYLSQRPSKIYDKYNIILGEQEVKWIQETTHLLEDQQRMPQIIMLDEEKVRQMVQPVVVPLMYILGLAKAIGNYN